MSNPTMVVGASRGLGRGVAAAFAADGSEVVAVARDAGALEELARSDGGRIVAAVADAAADGVAETLLARHNPSVVVLVAGATPAMLPLQEQSWDSFSVNWETDVRISFQWLRAMLRAPLAPGGRVIVFSSGAAIQGSPLSGGYAGAKGTQRWMAAYAHDEAARLGLGITVTAVMPRITPHTELGRPAIQAYAARRGQTEAEYLAPFGAALTPDGAGAAVVALAGTDAAELSAAYLLTGDGLKPLG